MIKSENIVDALKERIRHAGEVNESSVLDYKLEPHDTKSHICEFLRDIISLLNSSTRPDEDRFLIYGVENKTRHPLGYSPNLELDDAAYQDLFRQYIYPTPTIEFHSFDAAEIIESFEPGDRRFSCFYIPSSNYGPVYEIAKSVKDKDASDLKKYRQFEVGTSFTRNGSQIQPMTQNERDKMKTLRRQNAEIDLTNISIVCDSTGFPVICFAAVLGSWDEASENDKRLIEDFTGTGYGDWVASVRQQALLTPGLIKTKGTLIVVEQREKILGRFKGSITQSRLDALKPLLKETIGSVHGRFDLDPDKRFAAALYGKEAPYSGAIKTGLAEFLAMLGVNPKDLSDCPIGKVASFTFEVISSILMSDDWKVIASADSILPLLAESNPQGYLILVGRQTRRGSGLAEYLSKDADSLFEEKCGRGLFTGIRFAAISEDLFAESFNLLLKLLPFSRYASESITSILLPWLPQTNATVGARKAAGSKLGEAGCWDVLVSLLPNVTTVGFPLVSPKYRLKPEPPSSVTVSEFWEVSRSYVLSAISCSANDSGRLLDLIKHFNSIVSADCVSDFMNCIERSCESMTEDDCFIVWSDLLIYLEKCRKYANATWVPKAEIISLVSGTVAAICPPSPKYQALHLFAHSDFDLYEDDWEKSEETLKQKRLSSLESLYQCGGWDSVKAIIPRVQNKAMFGSIVAMTTFSSEASKNLYPSLGEDDDNSEVAKGFARESFRLLGEEYLSIPSMENMTNKQAICFYASLPCKRAVWEAAETFLEDQSKEYWQIAEACRLLESRQDAEYALSSYISVNRAPDALLLAHDCIREELEIDRKLVFEAVRAYKPKDSPGFERHFLPAILDYVKPVVPILDIGWEEFRLYPLFDEKTNMSLHKLISESPEFFSLMISMAFGSVDATQNNTPEATQRAYQVLWNWRVIPGESKDGFCAEAFERWIIEARELTRKGGLVEAADRKIGECLFHAPANPDGLFINSDVAKFLDSNDDALIGYSIESVNSRGAVWVDGKGTTSYALAKDYQEKARSLEAAGYFNFAATVREIASDMQSEGDREVEEAFLFDNL